MTLSRRSTLGYIEGTDAILAAMHALIDAARESLILQMNLFAGNGDQTLLLAREGARSDAAVVAGWLVAKKRAFPAMPIVAILDSNTPSDSRKTRRQGKLVREMLVEAGVVVLTANLFGTRFDRGPHILRRKNFHEDFARVPVERWVEHQYRWQVLHNVEDHRKNLVVDAGRAALVTSHNLIDPAFDWHENAFLLGGDAAYDLAQASAVALSKALAIPQPIDQDTRRSLDRLTSEWAAMSPGARHEPLELGVPVVRDDTACVVENAAILARVLELVSGSPPGSTLLVATTYLSDVKVFEALVHAARRGVCTRVLIDSIDALPLPAVPSWLARSLVNHRVSVAAQRAMQELPSHLDVRVHHSTNGQMMHLKTIARLGDRPRLVGGQANFTYPFTG